MAGTLDALHGMAREPGAWRHLKIPEDIFLEPMDPEDLDAAEGKYTDELGISLAERIFIISPDDPGAGGLLLDDDAPPVEFTPLVLKR